MKSLHSVTFILLVIGGLNWLLIGVIGWGVGDVLSPMLAKIVYILVGLSALYELFTHKKRCKECMGMKGGASAGMGGQM